MDLSEVRSSKAGFFFLLKGFRASGLWGFRVQGFRLGDLGFRGLGFSLV